MVKKKSANLYPSGVTEPKSFMDKLTEGYYMVKTPYSPYSICLTVSDSCVLDFMKTPEGATMPYATAFAHLTNIITAEHHDRELTRAKRTEEGKRLLAEYKSDLLAEYGLIGSPIADSMYAAAWDIGHSSGFTEVHIIFSDLYHHFSQFIDQYSFVPQER